MELLNTSRPRSNSRALLNYFKVVFQFGYCLLLIPFRLQQKGGKHVLTSNRLHQVFCAIIQTLVMYEYVSMIRFIDWNRLGDNAFNSLHAVTCFSCVIYGLGFLYTVWLRKDTFGKLFDRMEALEFLDGQDKWIDWKVKAIAITVCTWYTAFAMTDTTLHDNSLLGSNVSGYFSQLWNEAQACYLFKDSNDAGPQHAATKLLAIIAVGIHFLIALPRVLLIQITEITVIITSICLWHAMRDFLLFQRRRIGFIDSGDEIFLQYSKLKELVAAVNRAMSTLIGCVIGVSLPFYASWTAIVFFEENVELRHLMHFYIYFGSFFTLLTIAADFNSKSGEFYSWAALPENSDKLPPNRMTALLMDMHGNQIALKGSGIFVITYRLLGTLLSVIVTYTIIIIQFQVSKRGFATQRTVEPRN